MKTSEATRRHRRWLRTSARSLLTLAWLLSAIGCSRRAEDCNYTLTCAAVSNDSGVGGVSGTGGTSAVASACKSACGGGLYCDKTLKKCVECVDAGNCTASEPFCNGSNQCVQCLVDNDCTNPAKSFCSAGTCAPCESDDNCTQFTATKAKICKPTGDAGSGGGTCVQCTIPRESVCGTYSCNPAANTCTTTTVNTVKNCEPCFADSECDSSLGTARCVLMNFKDTPLGGYCLRLESAVCVVPYSVRLTASSLSGAQSANYCGIDQTATTCKAVLDLVAGQKTCTNDTNCGLGQGDGLCKTVGTIANRCTIPCASGTNCLVSAPGNICAGANPTFCQ